MFLSSSTLIVCGLNMVEKQMEVFKESFNSFSNVDVISNITNNSITRLTKISGNKMVVGTICGDLLVYDYSKASFLCNFKSCHTGEICALKRYKDDFNSNTLFYSSGRDCLVKLWSFNNVNSNFKLVGTIKEHEGTVLDLAVNNQEELFTCCSDFQVRVFDLKKQKQIISQDMKTGFPVKLQLNDKDPNTFFSITNDGRFVKFDKRTKNEPVSSISNPNAFYSNFIMSSFDPERAVISDYAGNFFFYDLKFDKNYARKIKIHNKEIMKFQQIGDKEGEENKIFMTISKDSHLKIWRQQKVIKKAFLDNFLSVYDCEIITGDYFKKSSSKMAPQQQNSKPRTTSTPGTKLRIRSPTSSSSSATSLRIDEIKGTVKRHNSMPSNNRDKISKEHRQKRRTIIMM